MRGEEDPRQLLLDLLDERNPRLKDLIAERDNPDHRCRSGRFDGPVEFPVDVAEQKRNREIFMSRTPRIAARKPAASANPGSDNKDGKVRKTG